jgi:signal transduction histidine kinase/ActR/RegA family two-component response regulator
MQHSNTTLGKAANGSNKYILPDEIMKTVVNVTCAISIAVSFITAIVHYLMGIQWIAIIEIIHLVFELAFWIFALKTKRYRLAFQLAIAVDYIGISFSAILGPDLFLTNIFWLALFPPLYIISGNVRTGCVFFALTILQIIGLYYLIEPKLVSSTTVTLIEGFLFTISIIIFISAVKRWQDKLQIKTEFAQEEIKNVKDNKIQHLIAINHEIRNPLTAVLSSVELLKSLEFDTSKDEFAIKKEQAHLLGSLQSSCNHILMIVNEVLDFERLDKKTRIESIEYVDFDPRDVVKNVIDILSAKATEKGLKLISNTDSLVSKKYKGPSGKVQQVLLNLISNALQHSGGDVTVFVNGNSNQLVYTVSDTGKGIPQDEIDRLFVPFSSGSGHIGTSGLGLSICKAIVDLMRGSITVESQLGIGTSFIVKLPLTTSQTEISNLTPIPKKQTTDDLLKSIKGLKILFVEDDDLNNKLTSSIFTKLGMQVFSALDSTQALELNNISGPFDIAVIDNDLGFGSELDGIKLTSELINTGHKNIIGFTGNFTQELAQKWKAAGVSQIILKPAETESILRAFGAIKLD